VLSLGMSTLSLGISTLSLGISTLSLGVGALLSFFALLTLGLQQRKKCAHIISTISTSHTTTAANTTLANTADGADSVAAAVNNVGAAATAAADNNGGGAAAAAAAATVANVVTNHTAVTATALHGSQCSSPGSASAHPALSRRRPWQTTHIAAS
jgi:hypothetical protein